MDTTAYRFSITKKMVLGISLVAIITYTASAFFIFYLYDIIGDQLGLNENTFMALTLVLGVAWTAVLGYLGSLVIVKPLRKIEAAARQVAQGDIREKVDVPKSDDELRGLAIAYNDMIDSLSEMIHDVNDTFQLTNQRVLDIKEASSEAANQAETISQTVDDISNGAQESSSSIQATAEAMEDVRGTAESVQSHAEKSGELSRGMVASLNESQAVIASLVTGIQQLAEKNETSLTAVQRLDDNARKVGEIISLVGDIAEQTNLLALNASIEAARAGEHGKGFAVVADEVRKLADQSGNAVQGITDLIQTIQSDVTNVVAQITEQVKSANHEAEKGTKTNEAIVTMGESVTEVAEAVQEILQLVESQVSTIERTATEAQTVAGIAEQTAAGTADVTASTEEQTAVMQEVASSAEMLLEQAKSLKASIEKFSINEAATASKGE
ncbi:methyl-accepting chemotaxis protein [Salisediminibacterium beveridgei]|uniref:Methyl-accepting chemotaxis protein n=1 Tax=Salisediminibacterium beveridgei TaxID=632773 RepID=A0A1D7QRE3_9BACI|nr:HAMP domain-containing methyl-accepting chemotaxis protein [Salisediminibacterium beveridgei]AOM81568.1 Methyl-accepting chemotaxis protein [Salisediminibacterium beveridgei]